jgi:hypothetical protein
MEKIIRVALGTKFGNNVDTLLEIADMTPNRGHAVELLLGIYEEPIFKALHTYTYKYKGDSFKNLPACFNEYNPWNKTMLITVVRPVSIDIVVLVEHQDIVNADNYTEYELSRDEYSKMDRNVWERITITLNEKEHVKEIVQNYDVIADWLETNLESEL